MKSKRASKWRGVPLSDSYSPDGTLFFSTKYPPTRTTAAAPIVPVIIAGTKSGGGFDCCVLMLDIVDQPFVPTETQGGAFAEAGVVLGVISGVIILIVVIKVLKKMRQRQAENAYELALEMVTDPFMPGV